MSIRCMRCRGLVDADRSAFAVKVEKKGGHVLHDLVFTSSLKEGDVALHVNGDRECGKQVSSFKGELLEKLGFASDYDIAFLDSL